MENSQLEHKLTAEQIENDCPDKLKKLGKHIAAHLRQADEYEEKACVSNEKVDQHITSAAKYLVEARESCDDTGFAAFQKKYCPDWGKTRVYELLEIGTGKKSVQEIRASIRERVARHRANKALKATQTERPEAELASDSVTVTENGPEPESQEAPTNARELEVASIVPEPPAKPRSGVKSKDEALSDFSARVMDLIGRTAKQRVERFAATSVPEHDLAMLGKFLMDLASLKKSGVMAVHRTGMSSAEIPEDEMRAKMAALDSTEHGGDVT